MKKTATIIFLCFGWLFTTAQNNVEYERVWATYFGGQNTAFTDSAIDIYGNVYAAGRVYKDDESGYLNSFTTPEAHQPEHGGGVTDGIIAKFSPDGLLVWATYFGGENNDYIYSVAVDREGNLVVGGITGSNGLATSGVHQSSIAGGQDAFIAKFQTTGELLWCTYYGGSQEEFLRGLDTDTYGNIYIGGSTLSPSGISTPGTFHPEHLFESQNPTGFLAKFNEFGQQEWGTYYGNVSYDETNQLDDLSYLSAIAVNDSGLFVTGEVYQTTTDYYFATPDAHQPVTGGSGGVGHDVYLSKFSLDNGQREWSTYYGGSALEYGVILQSSSEDIVRNRHNLVASDNYVYLGGGTWSNNNIATTESYKPNKTGIVSHFIAKFDNQGNRIWGTYLGELNIPQTQIEYVLPSSYSPLFNFYPSRISLSLDKDENVVASGSTIMNDLSSEGSHQETRNTNCNCTDAYTVRISSDGTNLIYGTYYGGGFNETATKTLFHNQDFYIIGTTQSLYDISTPDSFQEGLDFLINTDNIRSFNGFLAKFSHPLSTDESNLSKSVVYPNPNSGDFFVSLNENYINGELLLYNLNGKLVYTAKIDNTISYIQTNILTKGVYLLKIVGNRQNIYHLQKIIID